MAEEFKNENYVVNVTKTDGCRVELSVEMSPAASLTQWKKAIKAINKQISLPGFRKGKAPESLLLDQYAGHIESEWKQELLQEAFRQSIQLTNLYPYRQEAVQKAKVEEAFREGKPSRFTFVFETPPSVPDVDLKNISFSDQEQPKEVTDQQVDAVIEDIRYQQADWEEEKGRTVVQEGDFVNVNVENLDNPGQMLLEDTRIEVKEGKIGDWLRNALVGMQVGESCEKRSENEQKSDSFIPTFCKITVLGIYKSILPAVDDEFAKKAKAESIDDLKSKIRKDLEEQSKREARNLNRENLSKAVVEAYPFDIPHSLSTAERQRLLSQKADEINNSSLSDDEKQEALKKAEEQIKEQVESAFRWQLIADKMEREKKFAVDRSEVYLEMMRERLFRGGNWKSSNEQEDNRDFARAYARVVNQKASDYLLDALEKEKASVSK